LKDVYWLAPEGRKMTPDDRDANRRAFGMQIGNDAVDGGRFLLLLNAAPETQTFHLRGSFPGARWVCVFDTRIASRVVGAAPVILHQGGDIALEARSLMLFQLGTPPEAPQ
jgi:isoamylase